MLRDFIVALSLANLWFFHVWRLFLISHPTSYPYYHWKANPAPILLAAILDSLLLATMLWLGVTLARRSKGSVLLRIARGTFLLMCSIAVTNVLLVILIGFRWKHLAKTLVDHLRLYFPSLAIATIHNWFWIIAAVLALIFSTLLIHAFIYKRQRLIKLAVGLLLILSPFVLFTFSQAAWQWNIYKSGTHFRDNTVGTIHQPSKAGKRLLWIVFDELDYRLSFLNRSPEVRIPELDRLSKESVFAENAYPPSGDTILSLPALITGRLVSRSTRIAPNELMLTFADNNEKLPWSSHSNVFSSARSMGLNTALAGWYHPYCRIIGRSLTQCSRAGGVGFLSDQAFASSLTDSDATLVKSMLRLAANSLIPGTVQLFARTNNAQVWRETTLKSYAAIHQQALVMIADPELDVIMIHYPIPHPPGIYNRVTLQFSSQSSSGYLDNLELADRTVGELRRKLEEQRLWENTIVLISSDHSLRADRIWRSHPLWAPRMTQENPAVLNALKDERVPFILKVAGKGRGLNYEAPFNTVLSQALLLELLSDRVSTEDGVVQWLNRHRSVGESPYIDAEK